MSPIPSVATAFTLSPTVRSVALDPDSAGQSASVVSQHLLGTGGLLFAVVAIFSVAGYFYHGRGQANSVRTNNTWASLSSLLSSIRHRGSATTSTATAATDWPVDLEVGPERHVSMVYARFFHPTFWNLVECHPATSSAPAIYVEDEANEVPVSDPKPPGMSSFLSMDDDDDSNGSDDSPKRACEEPGRGARPRVEEFPPYDTSSPINVNFTSEIIGTTVRSGAFLSVQDEPEDDPSESLSSDSELDFSCSAYDGIAMSPPRSSSSLRRHGMADMAHLAQSLKDTIPEEGYDLVPTISHRARLLDVSMLLETDPATSCRPLERVEPADDEPTTSDCDIDVHDDHGDLRKSWSDPDSLAAPHEGVEIMRRLLAELRDPRLDCSPRALSEDSDSESYDDDDEEEATVPPLTPAWHLDSMRRNSLESTSSTPTTGGDASEEGPIYPLTPPAKSALASVADPHKAQIAPLVTPWFEEEVQVMSPVFSESPPSLPTKAYVRTHRDSRLLLYGPRLPLAALPRL